MDKIVLDSNVWIAFFVEKDSLHEKAKRVINEIDLNSVFMHQLLLNEIVSIIRIRTNAKDAAKALSIIISTDLKELPFAEHYFHKAIDYALQARFPKLSMVDLFLLSLTPEYKVITFDKALKTQITKMT